MNPDLAIKKYSVKKETGLANTGFIDRYVALPAGRGNGDPVLLDHDEHSAHPSPGNTIFYQYGGKASTHMYEQSIGTVS
jgi:hypothetical protein